MMIMHDDTEVRQLQEQVEELREERQRASAQAAYACERP